MMPSERRGIHVLVAAAGGEAMAVDTNCVRDVSRCGRRRRSRRRLPLRHVPQSVKEMAAQLLDLHLGNLISTLKGS